MRLKSAWIGLLLSLVPGLGHLYMGRHVRAAIYGVGSLVIFFLSVFVALATHEAPIGLLFIVPLWGISGIDMLIFLVAGGHRQLPMYTASGPVPYHTGPAPAEGAAPSYYYPPPSDLPKDDRFTTILLSFIPGLGHFHLGLMQRGLTFLIGFFGMGSMVIFVSILTRIDGFLVFLIALPIIWFYSMFDSIQLSHRKHQGEVLVDKTVLEDFEQFRETGRKSKVLATLLAMFPGAGHMYLGLQRRGLQLMAFFLISIYVLDTLRLSLFLFLIPIIWFFSFFDALQSISRYQRNEAPLADIPVVDWLMHHHKWLGAGLLLVGGYHLADSVLFGLFQQVFPDWRVRYYFQAYFQASLVSIALIAIGLKLLTGSKRPANRLESRISSTKEEDGQ
ncbi:hypothetical protein [Paenibacillus koleovorans]|uniref:hypothetical protein n=1 Tax=Paenibacillus koleovorans TaxID=121608 RepID=UPI000FDB2A97|nr:hypothetical protein [Paenibacillus koleovorans]